MSPASRLLAGALVAALTVSFVLTAGPAVAADGPGVTQDQWRTARLVFGVIGLAFMALVAFRAVRGWQSRRRTSDDG